MHFASPTEGPGNVGGFVVRSIEGGRSKNDVCAMGGNASLPSRPKNPIALLTGWTLNPCEPEQIPPSGGTFVYWFPLRARRESAAVTPSKPWTPEVWTGSPATSGPADGAWPCSPLGLRWRESFNPPAFFVSEDG